MAELLPFMNKLHIANKTGRDLMLGDVMAPPQLDLIQRVEADINNKKPVRYLILKARQIGMSTIIEGLMFFHAMAKQNFRGTVLTHHNSGSRHLLGMTKYYFDSFWAKNAYKPKFAAQNQLAWHGIGSHIIVQTAGSPEAGRGQTPHFLHASEVAFWKEPEVLMTSVSQSISREPGTSIFLESTANGVGGYFYNTWEAAVTGQTQFTPVFYPYWLHPSYTAHHIGLGFMAEGTMTPADDEERFLVKWLRNGRKVNGVNYPAMDVDEIKSRLVWRREILGTECQGDINKLHQEYPANPEEAFIATGTNVFDLGRLRKVYEPVEGDRGRLLRDGGSVRFIKDNSGPLEIYRYPSNRGEFGWYMIGGDGKKATQSVSGSEGDYCCAQVLDRKTWDQCARWRGRLDQNSFGEQMILLGQYYNNAMLAPETGIGGPGVAAHIIARGYPNIWQHRKATKMPGFVDNTFGWISSAQTKPEAIGNLQSAIHDATDERAMGLGIGLRVHDPITYAEMKNYVVLPDGGYGNADGVKEHDDTVMALAIALTCTKYEAAMIAGDSKYQAPRYQDDGYKSELNQEEAEAFDQVSGRMGVMEGPVAMEDGGMLDGEWDNAYWLDQDLDYNEGLG